MTKRQKRLPKTGSLEPDDPEVLNADGVARVLGVSARLVLRLAREEKLPAKKVGREWRFRRSAVLAWLGEKPASTTLEDMLKDPRVKVSARKK